MSEEITVESRIPNLPQVSFDPKSEMGRQTKESQEIFNNGIDIPLSEIETFDFTGITKEPWEVLIYVERCPKRKRVGVRYSASTRQTVEEIIRSSVRAYQKYDGVGSSSSNILSQVKDYLELGPTEMSIRIIGKYSPEHPRDYDRILFWRWFFPEEWHYWNQSNSIPMTRLLTTRDEYLQAQEKKEAKKSSKETSQESSDETPQKGSKVKFVSYAAYKDFKPSLSEPLLLTTICRTDSQFRLDELKEAYPKGPAYVVGFGTSKGLYISMIKNSPGNYLQEQLWYLDHNGGPSTLQPFWEADERLEFLLFHVAENPTGIEGALTGRWLEDHGETILYSPTKGRPGFRKSASKSSTTSTSKPRQKSRSDAEISNDSHVGDLLETLIERQDQMIELLGSLADLLKSLLQKSGSPD